MLLGVVPSQMLPLDYLMGSFGHILVISETYALPLGRSGLKL